MKEDQATVDSTETKASYHLTLLAQLHDASCPKAESSWGKFLLINFFNIANLLRQVKDDHRELLLVIMTWGGEEYNSEPNTFWYNNFFLLFSFFFSVSLRGKVDKYPFFSVHGCQMFYACKSCFSAVVLNTSAHSTLTKF